MPKVPGYELTELVRRDAGQDIYRGKNLRDGTTKIVKVAFEREFPDAFAVLKREHDIRKNLDLDCVVKTYDVIRHDGNVSLIAEDFKGLALREVMRRETLSLERVLELVLSIARALGEIHCAGIIHNCIDPTSMLVDLEAGQVKLINFGKSTLAGSSTFSVIERDVTSELEYMSPEQSGRMNRRTDSNSDLYSLGIILYELLVGKPPFSGKDALEIVHAHLAVAPQPVRAVDDRIPEAVSRIVEKLIAKAPDDRYQTAAGLAFDLESCLQQLRVDGEIHEFDLGTRDVPERFKPLDKIVGREAELRRLLDAFESVKQGGIEAVMLGGVAGTGKSALTSEFCAATGGEHGFFAAGKFDEHGRRPFSALADAFEQLVQEILTLDEHQLDGWRRDICEAVHGNGQLIVDVVPSLELVIGSQMQPEPLEPNVAENRFRRTFVRFIEVFCKKTHPLVLLLDNMQWADAPSLNVLAALLGSLRVEALLVIGSYTDDKGGSDLNSILQVLRSRGIHAESINLSPLTIDDTARMIVETLRGRVENSDEFAKIVWRKTGGNPLFVNEFLEMTFAHSMIEFNQDSGSFHVDLEAIRDMQITDNVAEALVGRFAQIPEPVRKTLSVAAAIGSSFELATIADVQGSERSAVIDAIERALAEEFVVQRSPMVDLNAHRYDLPSGGARYAFTHTRVQQLAYSLISDDERPGIHLKIGRWLRDHAQDTAGGHDVFEIATQMNAGAALIVDADERAALYDLNVAAATKAQGSTSYTIAVRFLRGALAVLGPDAWMSDKVRILEPSLQLASCLSRTGEFEAALSVLSEAATHCKDAIDRARIAMGQIGVYMMDVDVREAADCGIAAADGLGIVVPLNDVDLGHALESEIDEILAAIDTRGIGQFIDLPELDDPEKTTLMLLLMQIIPALYQTNFRQFAFVCCRLVTISLRYGNCSISARAYGALTVIFSGMLGRYSESYEFGKLGVDLTLRFQNVSALAQAYFVWGSFASAWTRPLRESLDLFEKGVEAGIKYGDHMHAAGCAGRKIVHGTFMGLPVADLRREAKAGLSLMRELNVPVNVLRIQSERIQLFKWLRGELSDSSSLSDADFDEDDHGRAVRESRNVMGVSQFAIVRLMHRYFQRDYAAAYQFGQESIASLVGSSATITMAEHTFFYALTLTALYENASVDEQHEFDVQLDALQAQLEAWAENSPENFLQHRLLVEAERARITGDHMRALERYDQAVAAADSHGFPNVEALACELCADYWAALDKADIAGIYYKRASVAYQAWGAVQKVRQLEDRVVDIRDAGNGDVLDSSVGAPQSLDVAAVLKAARAMSGEIVMERLLRTLMNIVLEAAGAEFGSLVLADSGRLVVRASKAPNAAEPEVMSDVAFADAANIARGVVNYVTRTEETVVLDDAGSSKFSSEEYVLREKPKSVLCTPIVHQGKLVGVLYVENRLTTGAFTPDRVESLQILMSQVAISIQNARLFSLQEQQTHELERYRDHLEELVKERTRELEKAHARLLDLSRQAGMAEVASGVLHNVGNVLNSVSVGASVVKERMNAMRIDGIAKLTRLFDEHSEDLPAFLASDPRALKIPEYLSQLDKTLSQDRQTVISGLDTLAEHIEHMKRVIAQQQSYSRMATVNESCLLQSVFEGAIEICNAALVNRSIRIVRDFEELPPVDVDRHQVLQILVNLISNAKHALADKEDGERIITLGLSRDAGRGVRLTVADNGVGIKPEHMKKIFVHGFTTKKDGHGFGLHNCANSAQQMGGSLEVKSDGEGKGAVFTLCIPIGAVVAPSKDIATAASVV